MSSPRRSSILTVTAAVAAPTPASIAWSPFAAPNINPTPYVCPTSRLARFAMAFFRITAADTLTACRAA